MNAIMIMCHKNMEQVARLIKRCKSKETRIILHIDFRYDLSERETQCFETEGVYFTEKRLEGELDTRSLVDIAMLMVEKAQWVEKEENIHFSYYLLLSGQDYLTKSIEFINKELKNSYPRPYIDCTPYDKKNWIYHKFKNNPYIFKYHAWVSRTFREGSLCRKAFRFLGSLFAYCSRLLKWNDYNYFKRNKVALYGGSAWWILPDGAIAYIVEEWNKKEKYLTRLLSSYTPEETFFQIMVMRSPIRDLVSINPMDMVEQNCKTWAYFSDTDKPFKGHPYIFTTQEYEKLINKDCWIARKFDIREDSGIFDLLDKNIQEKKWDKL